MDNNSLSTIAERDLIKPRDKRSTLAFYRDKCAAMFDDDEDLMI